MSDWYKFRGWDATGQKGWVYGDLTHTKKVLKEEPYLADRIMVGGYEVVPESVGLWTGLKDKNGKEIFEGDIVECVSWNEYFTNQDTGEVMQAFRRKMYVEFRNGGFKMVEKMPFPMNDNVWDIIYNGDIEVIDTIFNIEKIKEEYGE